MFSTVTDRIPYPILPSVVNILHTMGETLHVTRKDLTSSEVLRELDSGNRVVIESSFLGQTMQMAIRERDGTYYCDTPVKLLTYESRDEMRTCLERYKLVRAAPSEETREGVETSSA